MTATLADVNTTLGVTNIALSSVVSEQKETNKGITAFVDFIKDKDADDSRRALEDKRESKPILKSIGSGIGGGLVSAGKSTFGFGKGLLSKLAIPAGFLGGFLTSLLSSKLLRGGVAGLGFMFGDQIAEMLTGPDAKKEVKDQVAGAVKGGALGFLLGPRFAVIGGLLGGLIKNETIDKEAGELVKTLADMKITLPSLSNIFKSINTGVADGLKGINAMLKGNFSVDSTVDALKLLGGAAFLISPAGSLFLLKGMAKTRVGRVLMAIAGLGVAANSIFGSDSKQDTSNPNEMRANEAKPVGGDVGGLSSIFSLDNIIGATTAAYLGKQLFDLANGAKNLLTRFGILKGAASVATSGVADLSKTLGNQNKSYRFFKGLQKNFVSGAAKFGMLATKYGPLAIPLAAGFLLDNKESSEKMAMSNRATKSSGKTSAVGGDFYKGTTGFIEDFQFNASRPKSFIGANRFSKPGINSNLSDYFKNLPPVASPMDPTGNAGDLNMVNSNNRTVTTNNNAGVVLDNSGAIDKQDNLSNQIKLNSGNLF
jgi:hypothetical protein